MKTIEVACGYIEELDNGVRLYYGGRTDNGTCFKDYEAWNRGEGIIYISEGELEDIAAENNSPQWTRESWEREVADELEMDGYPKEMWSSKEFVSALAFYVLVICDWQDLSTFLNEMTYGDDIEDMYNCEGFFSDIEKKW